jgi:MATE family multidrug resistance protein
MSDEERIQTDALMIEGDETLMNNEKEHASSFLQELKLLLEISVPTVAVQFSAYFIYPQTASAVGRNLGTEELAGFSLASLTGNLMCLSVIVGALSALDTLMPRAFGVKRYDEVGKLAIRGFLVCILVLLIPIIPLLTCVEHIFDALGQDPVASRLASKWLRTYFVGVPFVLLFRVIQRFLACQQIVLPIAYAGLVGCFLVHPLLLRCVIPAFGFLASAGAIVTTQFVQAMLVVVYLWIRPVYHIDTWKGISVEVIQQAVEPKPMIKFFKLSLGGVVSLSEWWFWEVVCFLAGHMGVVPLCIHTIAYNLIPVFFMIPLGFSIGLSVRMGHLLAEGNVKRAKLIARWCMAFVMLLAITIALAVFYFQGQIVALFTSDEEVIEGCRQIWPKTCIYITMNFCFGINGGILRALGMQWRMAFLIFAVLWCAALPTLVYVLVIRQGGVNAIWTCLPLFYLVLNGLLIYRYVTADWYQVSRDIRKRRSSVSEEIATETTLLLDGIEPPN